MTLQHVIQALAVDGDIVEAVRFGGVRFSAVVQVDSLEVARRRSAGVRAILEPQLLEAMATLPFGIEFPLPGDERLLATLLDRAPSGLVEFGDGTVTRLWKPAVRVHLVLVRPPHGGFPLIAAAGFAADAPRSIVLETRPPDAWLLREAELYGVGVVLDADVPSVLVAPSFERRGRPSPRHWWFLETVYDRWLTNSAPASTQPAR